MAIPKITQETISNITGNPLVIHWPGLRGLTEGVWVQSLVRELRSHERHGMAKKKKITVAVSWFAEPCAPRAGATHIDTLRFGGARPPALNRLPKKTRKVMPHLATRGRASPQTDKDGLQRAVCPCLGRGWRQVWGSLHPPGVGGGQGLASECSASRPSVYLLGAAVVLPQHLVSPPPGWRPGQHPPLSGPTSEALAECGGPQSWVHRTHTRPRDPLLEQGP